MDEDDIKDLSEDLVHAIEWVASEYGYLVDFKKVLRTIKRDSKPDKDLRKAAHFLRYVGKSERRAYKFEKEVGKSMSKMYAELSKAGFDADLKYFLLGLRDVMRQIGIERDKLAKYASWHVGDLDKDFEHLKEKGEETGKDYEGLVTQIMHDIDEMEKWIGAIEVSMKKAQKVLASLYTFPQMVNSLINPLMVDKTKLNPEYIQYLIGKYRNLFEYNDLEKMIGFRNNLRIILAEKLFKRTKEEEKLVQELKRALTFGITRDKKFALSFEKKALALKKILERTQIPVKIDMPDGKKWGMPYHVIAAQRLGIDLILSLIEFLEKGPAQFKYDRQSLFHKSPLFFNVYGVRTVETNFVHPPCIVVFFNEKMNKILSSPSITDEEIPEKIKQNIKERRNPLSLARGLKRDSRENKAYYNAVFFRNYFNKGNNFENPPSINTARGLLPYYFDENKQIKALKITPDMIAFVVLAVSVINDFQINQYGWSGGYRNDASAKKEFGKKFEKNQFFCRLILKLLEGNVNFDGNKEQIKRFAEKQLELRYVN